MTKQQVFDKVCRHLRKQGVQCSNKLQGDKAFLGCRYRVWVSGREYRCAAGALLDMRTATARDIVEYANSKEFSALREHYGDLSLKAAMGGFDNFEFVEELQQVHDEHEPHGWADALALVAERWGLKMNVKFPEGFGGLKPRRVRTGWGETA